MKVSHNPREVYTLLEFIYIPDFAWEVDITRMYPYGLFLYTR